MSFQVLKTPRLVLDAYQESDKDSLNRLLREDAILGNVLVNESGAIKFMNELETQARLDKPQMVHWFARLNTNNKLIGCVKARDYHESNIELVIFVTEAERGNRYGTEMTSKVVEHLTSLKNVKRLWARTNNPSMAEIFKVLGFERKNPLLSVWSLSVNQH